MSITALVLIADEHLLTVVPCRDMYARAAVCRQDAVKQTLVDCFGQCCHSLSVFVVVLPVYGYR